MNRANDNGPDFKPAIEGLMGELTAFRHDLHAHPELAFNEVRTSGKVVEVLKTLPGLRIQTGLAGGTGVVATLNADREGPCVLLRADMDALPIEEASELPYKSKHPGRMHACGHDGHTTCLIGAARVLSGMADALPGKVKFCFQPAEEDGAGGAKIIEDGALEDPRVDAAFALHGWPDTEIGKVIVTSGPILAASTPFEIDLSGRGGHAAYPHRASDLVVAAGQLITNAQAIRSRFIDPLHPVVISFSQVQTGSTHNVLPQHCHIKGTIRALSSEAHTKAQALLRRFVRETATSFDLEAEFKIVDNYPVLNNDARCAAVVSDAAAGLFGSDNVITDYPPGMGGEDFAFYAQRVPAAMWRIGVRPHGAFEYPALHNPRYNFSDDAIKPAVLLHCAVVQRFLSHGGLDGGTK